MRPSSPEIPQGTPTRFTLRATLVLFAFVATAASVPADPLLTVDEAVRRVENVMNRRAHSAEQHRSNYSTALEMLGQYRRQFTQPEQQARLTYLTALSRFRLEDYGTALAVLDTALTLPLADDQRPPTMLMRGVALWTLSRTPEGIAQMRELLARHPQHEVAVEGRFLLAQMLAEQGNTREAMSLVDSLTLRTNPPWAIQAAHELRPRLEMIGRPAKTFHTYDTAGQEISLEQFRGKVVLLDFWASWCAPCRASMPGIVDIYNRYHDRGFDIIGVSLDHTRGAMTQYTQAQGMTWRQISEFSGWNSRMATLYGVRGIPKTYLIDQQGRIAGVDLKGRELEAYVARLLSGSGGR